MNLEKDTTVSHYKILSEIGKGGMGEVYLAEDTKLKRNVAIKFLSEELVDDVDKLNRFVQEAKAASALNHPNIITIHEIDEADGAKYIALEFIDGETLTERLKKKLKFDAALDIATQIASALDAAHAAGIVHRDIKPDNVMVRKDGLVKILDFGIAKLTEQRKPEIESEDKTAVQVNTSPGMIIGTANYMSPEQAKGKEVDSRTDIFSFGVLLYQMITGELPFDGESPLEIIGSILNKEPKRLSNEDVPADLRKIINKTLRKDRDERYQTIKGLLADLKELREDLAIQEKLDKTVHPDREQQDTQVFKATTAAEAKQTTASGANDSITIKKSGLGKLALGIVSILAIAAFGIGYWFYSSAGNEQIESIAVMPFVNESGDKDSDYLSDGMTETLINSLSGVPNLKVKARSSVFRFKGKEFDAKKIASELDVQAILTGRVVQRGDELTLNLELVDPKTETTIWGNRYRRNSGELVALQREITRDVLARIKSQLSRNGGDLVATDYTENSEAYNLYLKGRFYWEKRTGKDLEKSLEFFEKAIDADPRFALAYTGLSESYGLLSIYGVSTPKATMPKARAAAEKALELNGNLAQAHSALGNVLYRYDFDFEGAEREFKRALELDPEYGIAHMWYAELLSSIGRHDEAIREIKRALEIDPLFLTFNRVYGGLLTNAGRFDEAEAQLKTTIELDENYPVTYADLASLYLSKKDYEACVKTNLRALELSGKSELASSLRKAFEEGGWKNYLKALVESVDSASRYEGDASLNAMYFIEMGENDKAIAELNKLYEMRSVGVTSFKTNRLYDPLRKEPAFIELLKKVGFPES
ncbi:MAG: FlgO family outer membrane protein [Acidobacteriota bacterium]|nr:FlgO family outer membrane protein [Acidobacteriota bacterium]